MVISFCGQQWRRLLVRVVSFAMLLLLLVSPSTAWAMGLSDHQSIEQPAVLIGPRVDAPVPIYLRPAANQPNVGYGMNGSAVTVLEQVASFLPEADQEAAWNHIRLDEAPYTEGWVQGRFLSLVMAGRSETP